MPSKETKEIEKILSKFDEEFPFDKASPFLPLYGTPDNLRQRAINRRTKEVREFIAKELTHLADKVDQLMAQD